MNIPFEVSFCSTNGLSADQCIGVEYEHGAGVGFNDRPSVARSERLG